jgi:hypothetical protein
MKSRSSKNKRKTEGAIEMETDSAFYEYTRRIKHDSFDTPEGIYCIRCACYYHDLDEYFHYHRMSSINKK